VKKRILLLERDPETRAKLLQAIGSKYDLFAVASEEEAIDACRTLGPFAIAVAEDGTKGMKGASAVSLLRRVHEGWPETVGLLLAPRADAAALQRAVKEPCVFRAVGVPCDDETLVTAVDAALSRHVEVEAAEAISEHLQFGKESLLSFAAILEERVDKQTAALERLEQYASDLNDARSTREIAAATAEAASAVLAGRGVQVQLWQAGLSGDDIGAGAGSEMSDEMHRRPIVHRGKEIGEICVDLAGSTGGRLSVVETALVASIGASAAVAVRHELARRELDRAQHATIIALARLAERRDMETGQHLERVSSYCRIVAEGLRSMGKHLDTITDGFIEDLACSSPLHDIGKVGIPDSILLKPGRLSPEEWVIMKTHAEIGGTTIDGVIREFGSPGYLKMGSEIAWSHHEKWDGSGYPKGLRGEEIPLSARIVAIADVYDALTTLRPYKPIWPHAEAVQWIASRSGSHFDPDVVEAFLARAGEADSVRGTLADDPGAEAAARAELEAA
jgi:response regulator RpfG family c-di-GMP phosphodiesterase